MSISLPFGKGKLLLSLPPRRQAETIAPAQIAPTPGPRRAIEEARAPMPPDEFERVVPAPILARYPVISHNCDDTNNLCYLGQTQRGTPVWINRRCAETDSRIVVGNIEPHQFQGFSGGASVKEGGMVTLVTDIVRRLLLTPASLENAVRSALTLLPADARNDIMPLANATIS